MLRLLKNNLILTLFLLLVAFPVYAANIDGTEKYAWSNEGGWVNMNPTNGGVTVTDSTLTGYAWAQNTGWISFDTTQSGVTNDGNGTLGGFAWSEGEGWLSFTGVTIDSNGYFSGTATGASSTITFDCTNCSVKTSWRPASSGSSGGSSSGGWSSSSANDESEDTASSTQNEASPSPTTPTFPVETPEQETPFDNNGENETGTTSFSTSSKSSSANTDTNDSTSTASEPNSPDAQLSFFQSHRILFWLVPGGVLFLVILFLYRRFFRSS